MFNIINNYHKNNLIQDIFNLIFFITVKIKAFVAIVCWYCKNKSVIINFTIMHAVMPR